jgi:hypothetical protein
LLRLKIDELYALLVNNRGYIARPNKKTGLEKANLLPNVQAAFGSFSAIAATFTVEVSPLLPITFAPVICEGENITNLKFEGIT